jgi:hypothetical protein
VDGTWTPSTTTDLLTPYGNEMRFYRGISGQDIGSGIDEYIPLGVFSIADVNIYDSGDGYMITLAGFDRARKVSRAKLADDYVMPTNLNWALAIRQLIAARYPGVIFSGDATQWATKTSEVTPLGVPLVFKTGDDPWEKALQMARTIGYDLYFDVYGQCALTPTPDPTSTDQPIVWTFQEGTNSHLLNLQKRLTDENAVNHVVVAGESTGVSTPVRGDAQNTDNTSPTRVNGPFGDVVYFIQNTGAKSSAAAQAQAQAELRIKLGIEETLTFMAIANPTLDAMDPIQVIRGKSEINARWWIDKMTFPLIANRSMNISCRRRRIG